MELSTMVERRHGLCNDWETPVSSVIYHPAWFHEPEVLRRDLFRVYGHFCSLHPTRRNQIMPEEG